MLANEMDSQKCCAKGKVDLMEYIANFEKQPMELRALKDPNYGKENHENFMENVWAYNSELSFGTLVLNRVILKNLIFAIIASNILH